MRRLLPLLLVAQLAGCTLVFPTIGGISAASSNSASRARNQPETASVGGRVMIGFVLGLCVDLFLLSRLEWEHQPEG